MFDPRSWMVYGAGAALALAITMAGTQTVRLANERAAHATTKAHNATTLQSLAELTAKAANAVRVESDRRNAEQRKASDDGQKQIDQARSDAVAAGRAADRLRGQLAAYVASVRSAAGPGDPKPADAGPPASEAVVVLADMFTSSDARAGELAEAFDASYAAGTTCERIYNALKAPDAP